MIKFHSQLITFVVIIFDELLKIESLSIPWHTFEILQIIHTCTSNNKLKIPLLYAYILHVKIHKRIQIWRKKRIRSDRRLVRVKLEKVTYLYWSKITFQLIIEMRRKSNYDTSIGKVFVFNFTKKSHDTNDNKSTFPLPSPPSLKFRK